MYLFYDVIRNAKKYNDNSKCIHNSKTFHLNVIHIYYDTICAYIFLNMNQSYFLMLALEVFIVVIKKCTYLKSQRIIY